MKETRLVWVKSLAIIAIMSVAYGCSSERQERPTVGQTAEQHGSLQIIKWGPRGTSAGKAFNEQPDGTSSIWIEQRGLSNRSDIELWFGGEKLEQLAVAPNQAISAIVPTKLFESKGERKIELVVLSEGKRVVVGTFMVE